MFNFASLDKMYVLEVAAEAVDWITINEDHLSIDELYAAIAESDLSVLDEMDRDEPWVLFPVAWEYKKNFGAWPHEHKVRYAGSTDNPESFFLDLLIEEERIEPGILIDFFDIKKYVEVQLQKDYQVIEFGGKFHYFK